MNQCSILKTITTGIFIVLSSTISGQEKPSKIETPPRVKTLVERKIEINKAVFENQYYAIQLYYGNNTAANRILEEFKVNFTEWEAELSFETPNYKVRVGRFKDLNLASQKLEEIRRIYPSAFLLEPNNL